jgi:hypothetical protein
VLDVSQYTDAESSLIYLRAGYENGRIAPSADAIIRLAQSFDVSCDCLLVEDAPRHPFRSAEDVLGDRLASVAELGEHDRELVLSFMPSSPRPVSRLSPAASAERSRSRQRRRFRSWSRMADDGHEDEHADDLAHSVGRARNNHGDLRAIRANSGYAATAARALNASSTRRRQRFKWS